MLTHIDNKLDIFISHKNYIKEISEKKNKTDFSQHACTNVFTAVAYLQVQCLYVYIYDVNNIYREWM